MIKLSRRLQAIADLVPREAAVIDIGTDHAFLPCFLVEAGISSRAIAIDSNPGPYKSACRTAETAGLSDKVEVRLGNGLAAVESGEAETVVIAGLGGTTICEILDSYPEIAAKLKCLVLQPMSGVENVRRWLSFHGWRISAEELLEEDGRIYEIVKAVHRNDPDTIRQSHTLTEAEILYGPLLLKERHPLLKVKLEKELDGLQEIRNQLAKSKNREIQKKVLETESRIRLAEELLQCL